MPTARRRLLGEVEHSLRDGRAVGARVELRGEVPQRQVELRCEHEHGQRRLEADAALGEPNAHDDGDERDSQRRGQLEDGAGQERDPERSHRRAPVLLAHLDDALGLRAPAVEGAQRRQPAHDVEEVVREQRQRLPALPRTALRVPPDEPHEHRDERQGQQHHAGGKKVDRRHEHENRDRHDDGEDDLREVAREGRLERVHARHGGRRNLGALDAVERSRPAPQPRLDEVEPKLGDDIRCRPTPCDLETPRRNGAADDDGAEDDERRRHVGERRAAERARGDARQQDGLREHEQRHDDSERGVDHEQSSRGARTAKETRVEGPHRDVRYEGSGRSPMRWRKT